MQHFIYLVVCARARGAHALREPIQNALNIKARGAAGPLRHCTSLRDHPHGHGHANSGSLRVLGVLEGGFGHFGDETMAVDPPQTNSCAVQSHLLYWA